MEKMKRFLFGNKLLCVNAVFFVLILGGILLVESGPEPWLASEKTFMYQLHNSLCHLDQAKTEWAAKENKSADAIPTLDDLTPYLGDWKNTIERLKKLGVDYKITSTETNQSDVATLTCGIRFRSAFCAYYRAGTTLCIQSGWKSPSLSVSPITLRMRLIWLRMDFFLKAALLILLLTDAFIILVQRCLKASKSTPSHGESTPAAAN
jgi:hypothetical protein